MDIQNEEEITPLMIAANLNNGLIGALLVNAGQYTLHCKCIHAIATAYSYYC